MGQVATIHRLTNGYKWGMVKNDVKPTILLGSSLPIKKNNIQVTLPVAIFT
jgi:hypothetical protein